MPAILVYQIEVARPQNATSARQPRLAELRRAARLPLTRSRQDAVEIYVDGGTALSNDDPESAARFEQAMRDARQAAAAHPKPRTPGLRITETDPELVVLYDDLQNHQLAWDYLVTDFPDDRLYWLAGHVDRPSDMTPERWLKLSQNSRRARQAAERRATDLAAARALEFQEKENKRTRDANERLAADVQSAQSLDNSKDRATQRAIALAGIKSQIVTAVLAGGIGIFGAFVGAYFTTRHSSQPFKVQIVNSPSSTSAPASTRPLPTTRP